MVCIAITRGGLGDVWLFSSRTEAYLHPLVQYGDALLTCPEDVADSYSLLEWGSLRQLAGMGPVSVPQDTRPRVAREYREMQAITIFAALQQLAQPAPTDPAEICRRVTQDRRNLGVAKKKTVESGAVAVEAGAPVEKKGRGNLPPPTRGPKGTSNDTVIHMGTDPKTGVQYGVDHNPKKAGSKTHARFAHYRHGMTIGQALDAGIETGDLVYDRQHGFIHFGDEAPEDDSRADEDESVEQIAAE